MVFFKIMKCLFDWDFLKAKRLKMVAGFAYIPKNIQRSPLGEDASFICEERQTIGVADGVGAWAAMGIDAGRFARRLMFKSKKAVKEEPKGKVNLRRVLTKAFNSTYLTGSSTACIVTLKGHHLHVLNVGDSGFMIIRKEGGIMKSTPQLHAFNHPYQLGKARLSDKPDIAEKYKVHVKPGDIVIAATDGLFDNMFVDQIRDVVEAGFDEGLNPGQVARGIAEFAFHNSMDRCIPTPFAEAYETFWKQEFPGGKPDDITVIVALIVDI